MTENELKVKVLRKAYENGWMVYHVTMAKHGSHQGSQGTGYPDLTLARDGEVLWIELKQEKAQLTPEQAMWQAILPACHVVRPSTWDSGRVAELLA